MNFDVSFTNKEITPWGGMVFLKQMLDKMGFRTHITNSPDLPTQNSNRGHKIETLIESFITSIWCGATRFLHTEVTRSDKALAKIFAWDSAPGNDAYKRYFRKFTQAINPRLRIRELKREIVFFSIVPQTGEPCSSFFVKCNL